MDNQAFEMGEDVSRLLKLNLKSLPINQALTNNYLSTKFRHRTTGWRLVVLKWEGE